MCLALLSPLAFGSKYNAQSPDHRNTNGSDLRADPIPVASATIECYGSAPCTTDILAVMIVRFGCRFLRPFAVYNHVRLNDDFLCLILPCFIEKPALELQILVLSNKCVCVGQNELFIESDC